MMDGAPIPTHDEGAFHKLVVNTLVSGVTSTFLWFALTFWVYLETRSVVATGIIGGSFGLVGAIVGPWFGTYVDHHRKHPSMVLASVVTTVAFGVAALVYALVDTGPLLRLGLPWFWLLVGATLGGSVAGMARSIAMSTCVTLLVPEDRRDKANGLVGTVTGVAFAVTSVFSGLAVGFLGMGWAIAISVALTTVSLLHLRTIRFVEPEPTPRAEGAPHVDLKGALDVIRSVDGLWLLVALAAFNNLLGGVFMALLDAYGLELVSVQTWGLLWGFVSCAMIVGGLIVAKRGLGRSPLRLIIVGNGLNWIMCALFPVRSNIVLLGLCMVVWLGVTPMIEAAEQTVLQRVIPFERQGRVFGFSQLVENAASPVTSILMGPFAQTVAMPFMSEGGLGARTIGSWFGTGPVRGLALVFTVAGLLGLVVTLAAYLSRPYRQLSRAEARSRPDPDPGSDPGVDPGLGPDAGGPEPGLDPGPEPGPTPAVA